ncbi:hypothetical protein GCM10010168_62170 [Actinoplanes ianthinogenes]|uniref:CdiI immunity protein domain-containing protein n=1 Tax=Actinoplanes ianthinogenes TaxID=122358 RepID=A0ABM7LJW5_9ACTN|nr:hypothetical protein [Actinoplanes ianthinogenes]BCJ39535.1 hypothetical protein Aiant_01920 [Actinoplanes ianthinogenes]GGR35436.1 hypothetical protein GCM10010168_62170 [Actinoplanes ianthinogenes]
MVSDTPTVRVRGLVVPELLLRLLHRGAWRHPGEDALARTMPWFADELDFLATVHDMERRSGALDHLVEDETTAHIFSLVRGSPTAPVSLPWLDVDKAFFIAVAKYAGDDTAVALDYRTNASDPRVVASDIWTEPSRMSWRVVAPAFSSLIDELGLLLDEDSGFA